VNNLGIYGRMVMLESLDIGLEFVELLLELIVWTLFANK